MFWFPNIANVPIWVLNERVHVCSALVFVVAGKAVKVEPVRGGRVEENA
jgi:hypothetical protein